MTDMKDRIYQPQDDIFSGREPELMSTKELADSFEKLADAMQRRKDELFSCAGMAEGAVEMISRQAPLWKVRAVLLSFEDSYESLDEKSRDAVLSHLLDMMFNGRRSVRKAAAAAAGRVIASACEKDMSVWTDFLHRALFMKIDRPSGNEGLSEDPLRVILLIVYSSVKEENRKTVLNHYATYFKSTRWDPSTCLRLISGIFSIPVKEWGAMQRGNIGGFIRYFLKQDNREVRIASLYLLNEWLEQGWRPSEDFSGFLMQAFREIYEKDGTDISPAANELIRDICVHMGTENAIECNPAPDDRELFGSNLKAGGAWIYKLVNLKILKKRYVNAPSGLPEFEAYVAQLMILLRLNPDEMIFRSAGDDILDIADRISEQQKYEMVKELFKIIETGYDETGYVPMFLGRLFGCLDVSSQLELLNDIQELTENSDPEKAGSTLETVCCILNILAGKQDNSDSSFKLVQKLCGLLSQSMYSDLSDMVDHVLFSAGYDLFRSIENNGFVSDARINDCYSDMIRDMLICIRYGNCPDVLYHTVSFRYIASVMREISRTLSDNDRPVAFFSSSFDPFSNGHRAIVREIAEMGYQVYVNVHDFAWNRNTQPLKIRRQIAAMSVTDITHVQLFPEEITINMENPGDLAALKSLFAGRKVWLVTGSDRVENDPVYHEQPAEGSVHSFPHIVFVRNESSGYFDEDILKNTLKGDFIALKLPVYYEHMTSGEIRGNIREGKSIEGLVGKKIQHFIERHNLYADSRIFKPDVVLEPVDTEISGDSVSIYLNGDAGRVPAGRISYHDVYDEAGEHGCMLDEMWLDSDQEIYAEILLDETMIAVQDSDRCFCSCSAGLIDGDMLNRRGFILSSDAAVYTVSMKEPIVLFTDVTSFISGDFDTDHSMLSIARDNAKKLQRAVAGLFPGNLVLTIHSELLNYRLAEKIRDICLDPDGEKICVPFGRILKYVSIPGVIMMPLNTEKRYDPDLKNFRICEKTGYPSLRSQIRTIRSKDMPFVLVDDLYHKGYRMDRIAESLAAENMKEACVIVGVMSDMGRDLAVAKEHRTDSVYHVPGLKMWINSSDMIPFFGSDKIEESSPGSNLAAEDHPSIYPMLPYQFPSFLKEAPYEAVYRLSEVCMENAVRIFAGLEELYREKYHRELTFARLSEVIDEKGYPQEASDVKTVRDKTVSELLENEMTRLKRMRL